MVPVNGTCDARFERVRQVFEDNLSGGEDLGAACAVSLGGELMVDLYGGFQDRKKVTPWAEDTIVTIYSSGKAVVALLVAATVDRGLLDYDAPVASYWPDFAANGKERITLGEMMSHQAGLAGFPEEMDPKTWLDWDAICARLAAMPPLWPPGTANGYHPQTFGIIAGEVLRRVTGKTVGTLLREYFQTPFGLDIYCGLTPDQLARASAMTKPRQPPNLGPMTELKQIAFINRWAAPGGVDLADWAAAELPASNMHADARSLARLVSTFAYKGEFEGRRLFSEETFGAFAREYVRGDDLVLPFNISWAAGMMRNTNQFYGPVPETLGHSGFGGSCVFADPVNGIGFAYVLNKMSPHLVGDPRTLKVIEALYAAI